jgi:hypothetical protein
LWAFAFFGFLTLSDATDRLRGDESNGAAGFTGRASSPPLERIDARFFAGCHST